MANKDHVTRLEQGVAAWNDWRADNASVVPDLSGAQLHGKNLRDANLSGANLSGADLTNANLNKAHLRGTRLHTADLHGANLIKADLAGADLDGANLSDADLAGASLHRARLHDADLHEADLHGANLIQANLPGAYLYRADLRYANLHNANLTDADLSDASFHETYFTDVDLTNVIGLDRCSHLGPSSLDHRTLERSPNLPLVFLRGVGLPDSLIEYLPSLLNQPIQFYSCFISYSAKDEDVAARLYADLQDKGVRCWFDKHDLPIGAKILDGIDEGIRLRDKVLLILSEHSIKSDWVEDEVTTAFEEERKRGQLMLFPIRLDDTVMTTDEAWAAKLRARNIGDFRHWKDHDNYMKSIERVLRDLAVSAVPSSPPRERRGENDGA
jgi:uncharacterized protein YjbI with pentapeptide repeats